MQRGSELLEFRHIYFDLAITRDDFFAASEAMFRLARELNWA
jgi:hypothetical protein